MAGNDPEVNLNAGADAPAYQPRDLEVCNCHIISVICLLNEPRLKKRSRNSLELQLERHSVYTRPATLWTVIMTINLSAKVSTQSHTQNLRRERCAGSRSATRPAICDSLFFPSGNMSLPKESAHYVTTRG